MASPNGSRRVRRELSRRPWRYIVTAILLHRPPRSPGSILRTSSFGTQPVRIGRPYSPRGGGDILVRWADPRFLRLGLYGAALGHGSVGHLPEIGPVILPHDTIRFATAFAPDGSLLASSGLGSVTIWSCQPGLSTEGGASDETYRSLSFSPDGATLALGAEDGTIRLWAMPSARERMVLYGDRRHGPGRRVLARREALDLDEP